MVDVVKEERAFEIDYLYPCHHSQWYRIRLGRFGLGIAVQEALLTIIEKNS